MLPASFEDLIGIDGMQTGNARHRHNGLHSLLNNDNFLLRYMMPAQLRPL